MVICSLDALKKSSKKKETRIKKEIVQVLNNLAVVRSSRPEVLCKRSVLKKFGKMACNFIKKETVVQVFSCEFCEIFTNTFFIKHLWWLLLYRKKRTGN